MLYRTTMNTTAPLKSTQLAIDDAIADALRRDAVADAHGIVVRCDGGVVWLSGHVQSWAAYIHAEQAARATPGVRRVQNDIEVRTPPLLWRCARGSLE